MCLSLSAGLVVQKVRYSYGCTWPEWSACSAARRGANELGSILLLGFPSPSMVSASCHLGLLVI